MNCLHIMIQTMRLKDRKIGTALFQLQKLGKIMPTNLAVREMSKAITEKPSPEVGRNTMPLSIGNILQGNNSVKSGDHGITELSDEEFETRYMLRMPTLDEMVLKIQK